MDCVRVEFLLIVTQLPVFIQFSLRFSFSYYYPAGYPLCPSISYAEVHLLFHVPGINVGCFILDAVLQSDLSCLYNSSCLSKLNTYLNDSLYPFNATPLNVGSYSSLPTVGSLVDKVNG